jgi:hypothetical protein
MRAYTECVFGPLSLLLGCSLYDAHLTLGDALTELSYQLESRSQGSRTDLHNEAETPFREGRSAYLRQTQLFPGDVKSWLRYEGTFRNPKSSVDIAESIRASRKAVEADPDDVGARIALGLAAGDTSGRGSGTTTQ